MNYKLKCKMENINFPVLLTDDVLAELATIQEVEGITPQDIDPDLLNELINSQ